MEKIEDFAIRFQLIERNKKKVFDEFDMEIPNHVYGVLSSKDETPFIVASTFFNRIKGRVGGK